MQNFFSIRRIIPFISLLPILFPIPPPSPVKVGLTVEDVVVGVTVAAVFFAPPPIMLMLDCAEVGETLVVLVLVVEEC